MSKPIDMFRAAVDLALLHKLQLEKRIAEQEQRIARLKQSWQRHARSRGLPPNPA